MAKQITVFLENQPGRLQRITEILRQHDINIRAFVIQDRGVFGLLKLLVNAPQKARQVLADRGCAVALKDLLTVLIPDTPGALDDLLQTLSGCHINIADAYGFVTKSGHTAVWCAEVEDLPAAQKAVESGGFSVLTDAALYEL